MKISKNIAIISIIIIIGIIVVVALLPSNKNDNNENDSSEIQYEKLNEVVFPVKVSKAFIGDLIKTVSSTGTIKSIREVDIISNISSTVEKINIYNGKFVNKGDTLIILDDREYQIAYKEGEVKMTKSQIDYGFLQRELPSSNNQKLQQDEQLVDSLNRLILINEQKFKEGKISEDEYLRIKNELDLKLIFSGAKRNEVMLTNSGLATAINELNRARLNISYTRIIAPFNGVIANFNLSPGQHINSGEKLFKILDNSKFVIDVGVLENEISDIQIGNRAEIKINALPGETFFGKVIYINPLIDPETKTCKVTVELNNINNKIKSGMFALVRIDSKIYKNRLLVPKEALLVRDERNLIFVAKDNLAKWQYVEIGESNDKYFEILDGVSEGDDVITEGNYNLAHDAQITIRE